MPRLPQPLIIRLMKLLRFLTAVAALQLTPWASADEVRVLAAGAAKHAVETLAPAFTQATGHTLRASYDTVGALASQVLLAPPGLADVLVLSDAALASLARAGRLAATRAHRLGQVVVGVAVGQGAALPDLSTADALRQALLVAPSVAYGDPARGATAGTHFAKVVDALALGDAIKGKVSVLPFGVDVITGVAQGRFALGISQSSEIMQHPSVRYAGPLPAPHGLATGYSAALASQSPAAQQFLVFLGGEQARREFAANGFAPLPP